MNEKKVALVTGAARGIGRAITNKLISEGYEVAAFDVSWPVKGNGFIQITGDITSGEDRKKAIKEIDDI